MHVINYAHERDGVLYHGTLSDLDGVPKATFDLLDRKKHSHVLDEGRRSYVRER